VCLEVKAALYDRKSTLHAELHCRLGGRDVTVEVFEDLANMLIAHMTAVIPWDMKSSM